ncbi:MAG: hypothetical protein JKY56_13085 [Kofleriaceae bacterium]|nr:hypothetical protein [Kofleriaceae bacterium]
MAKLGSSVGFFALLLLVSSATSVRAEKPEKPSGKLLLEAGQDFLEGAEISGLAQIDYLRLQRSSDELSDGSDQSLNEDRFTVRRARLQLVRDWEYVGVSSLTELFAGQGVRQVALDVHAQLPGREGQAPVLRARAGLFAVPFGFENYGQTNGQRFFGERSLFSYAFVPGRHDFGAGLEGHLYGVDWVVAAQNGEPLESGRFAGEDPNAAKDFSGRVRTKGRLTESVSIALSASFLYGTGFSPGTPPTKDTFEWRDLNEDGRVLVSELIPIPGSAGRASQNFNRWGLGSDIQLWAQIPRLGELFVYGELALAVNLDRGVAPADPILLGRDQRSLGYYVAAVQELGQHATLGVRFEHYEPSADALDLFGGMTVVTRRRFRTLTTGLSANLPLADGTRARILLEYEYQQNSLGRDNRGLPAQLDNDTLRVRAEMAF